MKPQIVMAGMLLHLFIVLITWIHSVDRNPNGGEKGGGITRGRKSLKEAVKRRLTLIEGL